MKRIFRYTLLLLLILSASETLCQEDATNRQYLFNLLNVNPAYAGAHGSLTLNAGFRRQWMGVPGSPQTMLFSVDGPVSEHHLGLGLQAYTYTLGKEKTTGANLSIATQLQFDEDEFLALGLQAGLMNYRIDRTSVALPFQSDPAFQTNTNVMMPTAGAGMYYQRPGFYASFSAPSLLVSTVKLDKLITINSPSLKNMQLIFTTGIDGDISDDIVAKPSLFLKWMNGNMSDIHVNCVFWAKNIVGLGASYRANDAILGILQLNINDKLNIGYSYGRSIGDRGVFSQGTHEIGIRLDLGRSEE
jgi:type IX secretion system PorP/SprF family membrane protein